MNCETDIQKCGKNLLLQLVVSGSIIIKLSSQVFMAAYEKIQLVNVAKMINLAVSYEN